MKRKIPTFLLLFALMTLLVPTAEAGGERVQLSIYDIAASRYVSRTLTAASITLDGVPLDSDMPAFLYQNRTMAPVRLLAERLGARVEWEEESRRVYIQTGEKEIVLTIGSQTALVNGQSTLLPGGVPAMMASGQGVFRTMVPLRFVSEHLGAQVEWDAQSYTAVITGPGASGVRVTGIQVDDHAQTVFIATQGTPWYVLRDFGDRAVVDLPGSVLAFGGPASISTGNEVFSAVRYAEHTDLYEGSVSVRVVLELRDGFTCGGNIRVAAVDGGVLIQAVENDQQGPPLLSTPINPESSVIVLDAGHGGSATGAQYGGIAEKDINLSVTRKVAALLEDCGYPVVLTRSGDWDVGLYERAEQANDLQADIFVSIHSNAAPASPDYTGIYTYHYPDSYWGGLLAQYIQSSLISATGAIDRGTKSEDFVVLRETDMAAVLVEMGFMTNHGELRLLVDSGYQDKLARGIAEGIIRYLNRQK